MVEGHGKHAERNDRATNKNGARVRERKEREKEGGKRKRGGVCRDCMLVVYTGTSNTHIGYTLQTVIY